MSYDPSTDLGRVRLKVADTDSAIFSDAEVQAALNGNAGSVNLAAADLLDALAALYARSSERIKTLDTEVDRKGIAQALREQAKALRATEEESTAFGVAEFADELFSYRERVIKQKERNCA